MIAEFEDGTSLIRLCMYKAENRMFRLRWPSVLHDERAKYLKRRAGARCAAFKTVYGSTRAYVYLKNVSYAARRILDKSSIPLGATLHGLCLVYDT